MPCLPQEARQTEQKRWCAGVGGGSSWRGRKALCGRRRSGVAQVLVIMSCFLMTLGSNF